MAILPSRLNSGSHVVHGLEIQKKQLAALIEVTHLHDVLGPPTDFSGLIAARLHLALIRKQGEEETAF